MVRVEQRRPVRIGIDRLAGHALGDPVDLVEPAERGRHPVVSFDDLARRDDGDGDGVVLDARREDAFAHAEALGLVAVEVAR